jgi:hypothetical protein
MDIFLKLCMISIIILSVGIFLLPLAFPELPSFPGEVVATFLTGMWPIQRKGFLLKLVGFGIQVIIAAIEAVAFLIGGFNVWMTTMYETSYSCLKLRSALKSLIEGPEDRRMSLHGLGQKYQGIRIMNILFNSIYEFRFYIILVGLAELSTLVGLSNTVSLSSKLPLPVFGIMVFLSVMKFLAVIFVMTVGSTVWIESGNLIDQMKIRNMYCRNKRVGKRVINSLPPLKVKVGSVNFIERMTPCVVMSFMIEHAISLIMLDK